MVTTGLVTLGARALYDALNSKKRERQIAVQRKRRDDEISALDDEISALEKRIHDMADTMQAELLKRELLRRDVMHYQKQTDEARARIERDLTAIENKLDRILHWIAGREYTG